MLTRLEIQLQADPKRPLQIRAAVAEAQEKLSPEQWALLEVLAMEVMRLAAADLETKELWLAQLASAIE